APSSAGRDPDPAGRLPAPPGGPQRRAVPAAPPPGAARPPRERPPRRRWSARRIVLLVALVLVGLAVLFVLYGMWRYGRVDRVPVADVLSTGGSGTNYLIVGSDTREGFDPNDPNAGAVLGDGTADPGAGERSDT